MLPDIGISEWAIIAIVALVVIGPKDLPKVLRTLGQWVAKMRGMASEFRASFDEMARQSELDDLRKEVEAMRRGQLTTAADAAEMAGKAELDQTFADIESSLKDSGAMLHPPMGHHYIPPDAADATPPESPPALPVDGPAEGGPPPKPKRNRARSKA